ncbi:hypothetical protein AMTRI_Chr08g210560 [Amborella trichopoda]|uniref:DYW domain-containing protein n=1 Tax=Amborella trichopoda TaxID=13333 RepID=W1P396_AMBTC|nr:pentatricopeptide repeat-containing protein At1g08070, chloroplastic [Amborella trichopoda]ERN04322.1 hypothetical protein AMTR_s00077p00191560 [Amborella trichopoda]|eukprot:XP_006842647.1 pentatricopeptide repeat-containing protein At1g08070, chloroplastic [Amborella trichopoda]
MVAFIIIPHRFTLRLCNHLHNATTATLVQKTKSDDDAYSYCLLLRAHLRDGNHNQVLELYDQMRASGPQPNKFVFPLVLKACAKLSSLSHTQRIHACVVKMSLTCDPHVASAMLSAYFKCDHAEAAHLLFDRIPHDRSNIVHWTAMLVGCANMGSYLDVLSLFSRMMMTRGMKPNEFTLSTTLSACSRSGMLGSGRGLHAYIIRHGFTTDAFVLSALLDMYAKCASLQHSCIIFDGATHRDAALWNSMIMAYGMHGFPEKAFSAFEGMVKSGLRPDKVTFVHLLSACSHTGLLDKGLGYLKTMGSKYGIQPSEDHYACIVDLLGRHGRVEDAEKLVRSGMMMNKKLLDGAVLGALLHACRIHGKTDVGKAVAEKLFKLEPGNVGNYVMMSNMYAEAGRWEEMRQVRDAIKEKGLKKRPGCSWIEVEKQVHIFVAGDLNHPKLADMHSAIESLDAQMRFDCQYKDRHLEQTKDCREGIDVLTYL